MHCILSINSNRDVQNLVFHHAGILYRHLGSKLGMLFAVLHSSQPFSIAVLKRMFCNRVVMTILLYRPADKVLDVHMPASLKLAARGAYGVPAGGQNCFINLRLGQLIYGENKVVDHSYI